MEDIGLDFSGNVMAQRASGALFLCLVTDPKRFDLQRDHPCATYSTLHLQ